MITQENNNNAHRCSSRNPLRETRVAATPETVKKLIGQGHRVTLQSGAGLLSSVPDSAYEAVGATIGDAAAAFAAELVLKVNAPDDAELAQMQSGSVLLGMLNPFDNDCIARMAARGITAFALEAAPRTSRAQSRTCSRRRPTSPATRRCWSVPITTRASCRC